MINYLKQLKNLLTTLDLKDSLPQIQKTKIEPTKKAPWVELLSTTSSTKEFSRGEKTRGWPNWVALQGLRR